MQLSQASNDLWVILGVIFDFWFLFAEMVERDLAAIITADEFKRWADYYLDLVDDSGASLVRVNRMLKCRREDTSKGVGIKVQKRLSNARDIDMMAKALCHPSADLRALALTEITEFNMSKETVATSILELIGGT